MSKLPNLDWKSTDRSGGNVHGNLMHVHFEHVLHQKYRCSDCFGIYRLSHMADLSDSLCQRCVEKRKLCGF